MDQFGTIKRRASFELISKGEAAYSNDLYADALQYLAKGLDSRVYELKDHWAEELAPVYRTYGRCLFDYSRIVGNLVGHSHIITSSLADHGFHPDFDNQWSISDNGLKVCSSYSTMFPIIWDGTVNIKIDMASRNNAAVRYFRELPILDVAWSMIQLAKRIYWNIENPSGGRYDQCLDEIDDNLCCENFSLGSSQSATLLEEVLQEDEQTLTGNDIFCAVYWHALPSTDENGATPNNDEG